MQSLRRGISKKKMKKIKSTITSSNEDLDGRHEVNTVPLSLMLLFLLYKQSGTHLQRLFSLCIPHAAATMRNNEAFPRRNERCAAVTAARDCAGGVR